MKTDKSLSVPVGSKPVNTHGLRVGTVVVHENDGSPPGRILSINHASGLCRVEGWKITAHIDELIPARGW